MQVSGTSRSIIRFGVFELDPDALELRKSGLKVNLQAQPFQILLLLLERRGAIVGREELEKRLWPDGTFVDFDHSVNAAIKRLRDALGDTADNPRFIETVPKRGYKFIAPIDGVSPSAEMQSTHLRGLFLFGAVAVLAAVAMVSVWWLWAPRQPRVEQSGKLSFSGRVAAPFFNFSPIFPALATDGSRVYFSYVQNASLRLAYLSTNGGEQVPLPTPLDYAELRHISPDGSHLLVYGSVAGEKERHLWLVPTAGGGPRRLESIDGHDGAWSPDGKTFVYATGKDLYAAGHDGSHNHKLLAVAGQAFWLRWSPDGRRIRFTLVDPYSGTKTLWECLADGSNPHRLPIRWPVQTEECCGEWARNGNHFYFRSLTSGRASIWSLTEHRVFGGPYEPVELTTGPIDFAAAVPGVTARQLFTVGVQPKWKILAYRPATTRVTPWIPGLSAIEPSFSPDGRWMAYVEGRDESNSLLWRSKRDNTERLQLSQKPLLVSHSSWSPDGTKIAFQAKMPDQPWNIYLVAAAGGVPRALFSDGLNALDPQWSADGRFLMFGRAPEYWAEAGKPKAIYMLDLQTNAIQKLAGSDGLYSPRWSSNGRYVVALSMDETELRLFDFVTQKWTRLASFPNLGNPQWSRDGEYLYIDGFDNELVRIKRSNGKIERIFDLNTADPGALACYFQGLSPEDDVLLACPLARGDIYSLDLDFSRRF